MSLGVPPAMPLRTNFNELLEVSKIPAIKMKPLQSASRFQNIEWFKSKKT